MNHKLFSSGLIVLVLAVGGWAQTTGPAKTGAEQEVLKLEKAWADAGLKGDAAFLEKIFAPDLVVTRSDGSVWTGAQEIAATKSNITVFASLVPDNMKVHVYGDAAVVSGRNLEKGKEKGRDFSRQIQWTDTWIKIGGQWKVVATQSTIIAAK